MSLISIITRRVIMGVLTLNKEKLKYLRKLGPALSTSTFGATLK